METGRTNYLRPALDYLSVLAFILIPKTSGEPILIASVCFHFLINLLVPDIGPLIQGNLTSIIARYVRICEKFTNTAIIMQPK